jgi:glutamate-1-semialdehyde 2,1-aminomutase
MDLIATGEVMHAGTFNGNPVGMAAALATLECLRENGGYVYKEMNRKGKRLMEGIRTAGRKYGLPVLVCGRETAFHVHFTPKTELFEYRDLLANDWSQYNYFQKRLIDFGVRLIFRGNWYLSAAHTDEDISFTLDKVDRVMSEMVPNK